MFNRIIATLLTTTTLTLIAIPAYAGWINEQGQFCQVVWEDTDGDGVGDKRTVICSD